MRVKKFELPLYRRFQERAGPGDHRLGRGKLFAPPGSTPHRCASREAFRATDREAARAVVHVLDVPVNCRPGVPAPHNARGPAVRPCVPGKPAAPTPTRDDLCRACGIGGRRLGMKSKKIAHTLHLARAPCFNPTPDFPSHVCAVADQQCPAHRCHVRVRSSSYTLGRW